MAAVAVSLWMPIKLHKEPAPVTKNISSTNYSCFCLAVVFYLHQCVREDSRAIYNTTSTYRSCLFYLPRILKWTYLDLVLVLWLILQALLWAVFCSFIWPGWKGKPGLVFLFSLIPSAFGGRGLCSWSIFWLQDSITAGFFSQVIPLYIQLWNPTGCLLSSA